jgi:rhodanese-related sulfurtransferase
MKLLEVMKALFRSAPRIPPRVAAGRVRSGEAVLIDVREPHEWDRGVADQAVLLSFKDLTNSREHWAPFLAESKDRELLLYCAAGGRSAVAARILASEGFRVANTGSLSDWAHAGWPIVKRVTRADPRTRHRTTEG